KSLLGAKFSVMKQRGRPIRSALPATVFATVHPSAVLRAPRDVRARAERAFLADIRAVARFIARQDGAASSDRRTSSAAGKLAVWPITGRPSDISSAPTRSSPP